MSDENRHQDDAFETPGSLLRTAREAQGISERDAADRLNLMPDYVGILERDDYQSLRSPPFARGYVRLYGRLLGLDEQRLLAAFDRLRDGNEAREQEEKRVYSRPMPLQHTGRGGLIGLAVLLLLVLALWWWRAEFGGAATGAVDTTVKQGAEEMTDPLAIGES